MNEYNKNTLNVHTNNIDTFEHYVNIQSIIYKLVYK